MDRGTGDHIRMTADELRALADAEERIAASDGVLAGEAASWGDPVDPFGDAVELATAAAHHARLAVALREAAELRERVAGIAAELNFDGVVWAGDVGGCARSVAARLRAALAGDASWTCARGPRRP